MSLSPDGIAPFLFTLIATLGLVPLIRRVAIGLGRLTPSRPWLAPVVKVLRHGGVAMAAGTALALFYVPVSGPYPLTLGYASALVLLAAVISCHPAWRRLPRLFRVGGELAFLGALVGLFLVPVLFDAPYQRPLLLLSVVCVLFLAAFSRLGVRADRSDPLANGYVAIIVMLSLLFMSTLRPAFDHDGGTFLIEIQEVGRAGAGALLACLFYAIKTSWRSAPAMRIGPDGHLIVGLFIVWSSLMLLAHFGNWATLAAALCWVLAAPVFWRVHTLITGRAMRFFRVPFESVLIVAVTLITCSVGIAVVALQMFWQPILLALIPTFVLYAVAAEWIYRRGAANRRDQASDISGLRGLVKPGR